MTKQERYRHRLRSEGKCERCGKGCYPYSACGYHRAYKNVYRSAVSLEKKGIIKRDKQGRWSATGKKYKSKHQNMKDDDCRRLPRFGGIPLTDDLYKSLILEVLKKEGKPINENDLIDRLISLKIELRKTRVNKFLAD